MHRARVIKTLDSSRLSRSDFLDFSNRKVLSIYSENIPSESKSLFRFLRQSGGQVLPFPAGTQGFLYFRPQPSRRWFASEVRFRMTRDESPSSFASGRDLNFPDFTPWCLPIVTIALNSTHSGLRHLLLRDGLIGDSILEQCATLQSKRNARLKTGGRLIHSFGQLFSFNFQSERPEFLFLTADGIYNQTMHGFYVDRRNGFASMPYTGRLYAPIMIECLIDEPSLGSALCCFEKSSHPSHKGTRTMVVRVKRITSPIETIIPHYDHHVPKPVEGELICRRGRRKDSPWSFDIDAKGHTGLRGLFEDSEDGELRTEYH